MLELRQVTWSNRRGLALRAITISVPRHVVYGVVGPGGSGKSALLDLLSGFAAPSSGTIVLDGVRLDASPAHAVARRGVARTFDPPRLLERSTALQQVIIAQHRRGHGRLWQEVLFNAETRRERVERRQRAAALMALVGLEAVAGQRAEALSEGDRRQLAIACAVAQEPDYLLLDEPTAGLAAGARDAFLSLVTELVQSGITIILATHDATLALRLCDRLAVLRAGALVTEGPAREVQVDPALRAAYGEGT